MTSAKHTHTIHIDAPVEKVFDYVADPKVFTETFAGNTQAEVVTVNQRPDGAVSSYEVAFRELGMHLSAVVTREEYVVNERITEHSSMGPVWTYTVAPDGTRTALTASWDASRLMKLIDAVFIHSDKDFESAAARSSATSRPCPERTPAPQGHAPPFVGGAACSHVRRVSRPDRPSRPWWLICPCGPAPGPSSRGYGATLSPEKSLCRCASSLMTRAMTPSPR